MGQYRLDEAKEEAIFDFIVAASGLAESQVIWDKQDIAGSRKAVKPALDYITMNISAGPSSQGAPELKYKELDTYEMPFRRAFTLTINVYSNLGWISLAHAIASAKDLESKRSILRLAGISILDHSDILDISELLDTKHEGRATVDLFLSDCVVRDDITGEIHKVGLTGTTGDFETEQEIEIP
ncbi:MAG: hypothetical protein KAJ55_10620 [Anaerolineales bacterium]|nr:hypothetical protein [Anaerolineales bacterium]